MIACLLLVLAGSTPADDLGSRVHGIQLSSSDMRDLRPLGEAIGAARIVQLGEQTHGDGTGFALRARIVEYLHRVKGFDVLVWESNLMECEALNAGFAGTEPVSTIARRAIFSHWSGAKECQPLFEYVRSTWRTSRPLRISGFDIQASGVEGVQMLFPLIEPLRDHRALEGGEALFAEADRIRALPDTPERQGQTLDFGLQVDAWIVRHRSTLRRAIGASQLGEIQHLLTGFIEYRTMLIGWAKNQREPNLANFKAGYDVRERANARNLEWLANVKYRGKKLIVWAHNSHVSHRGAEGDVGLHERNPDGLDSTGRWLKRAFGRQLYSLGTVATTGSWRWLDNGPIAFAEVPAGGLEAELARSPHAYGFVDLTRTPKGSPLRSPIPGFISRQNGELRPRIWPDVFDGLLYVRHMEPRTPLK